MTMIWLNNLKKVKEELRNEKWPRSAQEGFHIGTMLMAHALKDLKEEIKKNMPSASDKKIQIELQKMFIRFSKVDSIWIEKYRQDHGKIKTR